MDKINIASYYMYIGENNPEKLETFLINLSAFFDSIDKDNKSLRNVSLNNISIDIEKYELSYSGILAEKEEARPNWKNEELVRFGATYFLGTRDNVTLFDYETLRNGFEKVESLFPEEDKEFYRSVLYDNKTESYLEYKKRQKNVHSNDKNKMMVLSSNERIELNHEDGTVKGFSETSGILVMMTIFSGLMMILAYVLALK